MSISIIIPTLNNHTLTATLAAVVPQTRPGDELLVVGLDEIGVTQAFPQVKFISTGRPQCAAAVRNLGLTHATQEIFLFTDSDCIPAPDWVEKHRHNQAQGQLVVGGGIEIDHPNYWARADNLSMFHEFAVSQPAGVRSLLPTLNLSVHRSVWHKVGGMDESFPKAAGEDSDWTIRMRHAGYTLHFDPTAVVRHAPTRTTWQHVFHHWHHSGHNNIRVRLRYAQEYGTPWWVRSPLALKLLSPFIAAWTTAKIYRSPAAWPYVSCLPVVYATKIVYCFGAAAAVQSKFAFQ